jgi:general secretion pathway protein G
MKPNKTRNRESGFSLIEVLIAVTIIVLMGGVVAWNVFPALFQSQRDRAGIDIDNLKTAVKMYQMKEGKLPLESEWPNFLFDGSKNHPSPFVDPDNYPDRQVKDPWETPYVYKRIGPRDFEIISYGADGQQGGEEDDADISSKKTKE